MSSPVWVLKMGLPVRIVLPRNFITKPIIAYYSVIVNNISLENKFFIMNKYAKNE